MYLHKQLNHVFKNIIPIWKLGFRTRLTHRFCDLYLYSHFLLKCKFHSVLIVLIVAHNTMTMQWATNHLTHLLFLNIQVGSQAQYTYLDINVFKGLSIKKVFGSIWLFSLFFLYLFINERREKPLGLWKLFGPTLTQSR